MRGVRGRAAPAFRLAAVFVLAAADFVLAAARLGLATGAPGFAWWGFVPRGDVFASAAADFIRRVGGLDLVATVFAMARS